MSTGPFFRIPKALRPAMHAMARAVLPDELEHRGLGEEVVRHVERTLEVFPPHLRYGLLAGATVINLSAMLSPRHPGRTMASLPKDKAARWFEGWWHSAPGPLGQLPKGVKAVFALAYYEQPAIRQQLEYHPDAWIGRVARRRLERYADDIQRQDAYVLAKNPLVAPAGAPPKRSEPHD